MQDSDPLKVGDIVQPIVAPSPIVSDTFTISTVNRGDNTNLVIRSKINKNLCRQLSTLTPIDLQSIADNAKPKVLPQNRSPFIIERYAKPDSELTEDLKRSRDGTLMDHFLTFHSIFAPLIVDVLLRRNNDGEASAETEEPATEEAGGGEVGVGGGRKKNRLAVPRKKHATKAARRTGAA